AIGAAARVSRGWEWPLYEPLVAIALAQRLPLIAINLSRERARAIAASGLEVLGAGEPERQALAGGWDADRARALRRALVEGHCGEDGPRIDAMAGMQRARDALMADRILAAAGGTGVVAIVGRGHARADIGVPFYLRRRVPELAVLSLALVEVEEGRHAPPEYAEATPGRHDLLWFTPRAARPDPCAGFPRAGKAPPAR
ncbi:MAG TPA: ChaN family lipoprotein, partial [Myxococcota bacterium]|nr:ChaN family lipoprotein [Myxococcota bacterium]